MLVILSGVLATQAALAEASPAKLKKFSCISGRSTLIVSQLDETGKASVYLQLISGDYLENIFDAQLIDGGRFVKVNLEKTKNAFFLIDTTVQENLNFMSDLVWEGLNKEAIPGRKRFHCLDQTK